MAIHEQQQTQIEGGFVKGIEESSMNLLLDMFQVLQYSYPEKSTVRELVSNSIDATREREVAKSILNGQTKVEDHYVNREGSEYKYSHFDPTYYNLEWLSNDPNIYITYKEGSALEKDKIIIHDNGVGLGGGRLLGYFSLGYSTKRLSSTGIGKFGIGAKAALSTGVASYIVKNRYNGKETWWSISSARAQSILPKFDMVNHRENPLMTIENGTQSIMAHYMTTNETNGLTIEVEVKKHNKQKYIDAVKSQLLYFDNIVFVVEEYNGKQEKIQVTAPILYEDKVMILSKNDYYSKPHILVNRVNYGLIDFQELELEDKLGNISIKLDPGEVSISPNREKVIWDEVTRESIKHRFQEVQRAAEKLLQGELEQTDFMKWLKACVNMRNAIGTEQGSSAIFRLAKLVDISQYAPRYKPDPEFKLDWSLFQGLKVRKITAKTERHGSSHRMVVDREQVSLSNLAGGLPVLIQQGDTNWLRDRYMLEDMYQDGFITIWLNETEYPPLLLNATEEETKASLLKTDFIRRHALDTAIDLKWYKLGDKETLYTAAGPEVDRVIERVLDRWRRLNKYILESEGLEFYDKVEVPDNYKERNKGVEEDGVLKQEEEVKTKEAQQSAEERRKLKGDTVLFTPAWTYERSGVDDNFYFWDKREIPVTSIDDWNESEIYYSSDDDSSLLKLAAFITRPDDGTTSNLKSYRPNPANPSAPSAGSRATAFDYNPEVKLIKVAQNRVKYYRDFKHIRSFFFEVKNKVITMSNKLIKWNTARYIHQYIGRLEFLAGFARFHEEHHNTYTRLIAYHDAHYREVGNYAGKIKDIGQAEYSDMISHMDSVQELQIFVSENPNDHEAIAQLTKQLFGNGTENQVNDGCAIDMNIRNQLLKLLDYIEPIHTLLNEMPILTESHSNGPITEELELEIRNYLRFKGCL